MENGNNNVFMGITDVGQAESLLDRYICDHPGNTEGAEEMLNDLLEALLVPDASLTGDADDFHNMSVSVSRIRGESRDALTIVREGLKIHAYNTDLIADAIRYGCNCGATEDCAKWYRQLCGINKATWTWRAFSFSVDYLLDEQDSSYEAEKLYQEILELIRDYQRIHSRNEDAWLCEYQLYDKFNEPDKRLEPLERAMEKFGFCPRCMLRYAEIMIGESNYDKAEPVIRELRCNPKTSESVNISFVFYMDGLCKMRRLLMSEGYLNGEIEEKEVLRVYKDFHLALTSEGIRQSTRKYIEDHTARLERETEVENRYY